MASGSIAKPARRRTVTTRPPKISVRVWYMPKVGGQMMTSSPGSTKAAISRSINSSAPAPGRMRSGEAPV